MRNSVRSGVRAKTLVGSSPTASVINEKCIMIFRKYDYDLFIGYWQPFLITHEQLIDKSLKKGHNVCIVILNTSIDDEFLLTSIEVRQLIGKIYLDKKIKDTSMPDVNIVVVSNIKDAFEKELNYTHIRPKDDSNNITMSEILSQLKNGKDDWKKYVNPIIHSDLEVFLANHCLENLLRGRAAR